MEKKYSTKYRVWFSFLPLPPFNCCHSLADLKTFLIDWYWDAVTSIVWMIENANAFFKYTNQKSWKLTLDRKSCGWKLRRLLCFSSLSSSLREKWYIMISRWYYDDNDCNIFPPPPHPFQVLSPGLIIQIFTFWLHIYDFLDDISSIYASPPAAIVVDEVEVFVSTSLLLLTSSPRSAFWSHLQDLWRLVRLSLVTASIRFY